MSKFSVIIPVYNRPDEVVELLESLTRQTAQCDVEVIIVEDGSKKRCENEVAAFADRLNIVYHYQDNTGPGGARNTGAKLATGEYLIFFDSDAILPDTYFESLMAHLEKEPLDCFGGPDREHEDFTPIQKAISYSMTSILTTGGIRGGKKKMDKFYPRSFNLGVRRSVFDNINGYADMRYGEDVDFSMRVVESGCTVGLVPDAFVFHKRRNTFKSFFKQVFCSGTARIVLSERHKGAMKLVHMLPAAFTLAVPVSILLGIFVWWGFALVVPCYLALIFLHSLATTQSIHVALLSIGTSFIQLFGYGAGFLTAFWKKKVLGQTRYVPFTKTFYE